MHEQPSYQPPYQPPQQPPRSPQHGSNQAEIWRGIGLALLLHLIQIPLAAATVFFSLIFMGVSQLLYIIPAIVIYRRKGRPGVVKGLIIAAALTFLLNATCSALVLSNLNIH